MREEEDREHDREELADGLDRREDERAEALDRVEDEELADGEAQSGVSVGSSGVSPMGWARSGE